MQESIYNLIPKEKTPPKKVTKLYKSTIPGTIAPTGSTFGTQSLIIPVTNLNGSYIIQQNRFRSESGILGKSKIVLINLNSRKIGPNQTQTYRGNNSLDIWAEKGSIHRSVDLGHQHSATKPQIPKLDDKPIMGLKQHKNFIATNAIDVILASYILQYFITTQILKENNQNQIGQRNLLMEKFLLIQPKSKIPLKNNFMRNNIENNQNNKNRIINCISFLSNRQQMAEDELEQIRQGLKKKYDELNYQYQQQTHCRVFGTIGVKRRKENYEKELIQLEQDIEKLNKKYVFIQH